MFTVALLRQWWDDATCTFQDKKMSKISKDTMTCIEKPSLSMLLALTVFSLSHTQYYWWLLQNTADTSNSDLITQRCRTVWQTACLEILRFMSVFIYSHFFPLFPVPIDSFSCALVSNKKLKSKKMHFQTPSALQKSLKTRTLAFWGQIMQVTKRTKEYFRIFFLLCHCFYLPILVSFIVLWLSLHFLSHLSLWPLLNKF